jgi:hypothetical protein
MVVNNSGGPNDGYVVRAKLTVEHIAAQTESIEPVFDSSASAGGGPAATGVGSSRAPTASPATSPPVAATAADPGTPAVAAPLVAGSLDGAAPDAGSRLQLQLQGPAQQRSIVASRPASPVSTARGLLWLGLVPLIVVGSPTFVLWSRRPRVRRHGHVARR